MTTQYSTGANTLILLIYIYGNIGTWTTKLLQQYQGLNPEIKSTWQLSERLCLVIIHNSILQVKLHNTQWLQIISKEECTSRVDCNPGVCVSLTVFRPCSCCSCVRSSMLLSCSRCRDFCRLCLCSLSVRSSLSKPSLRTEETWWLLSVYMSRTCKH